ncbi:glycosyltransferase [Nostoc sp. C117]|uniref:glycosyltransferase n=1 Tax=Nostoc sp. C117 TaxID=3349875 RepID=UPI00370DDB5B
MNNIGGAARTADSLISSQVKAGYKVSTVVLTYLDLSWTVDFKAGEEVIIMKVSGSKFNIGGPIHQILIAKQLSQVITNQKPDLIICHTAFVTKLYYLSKLFIGSISIPYISYIHSDYISESMAKVKADSIKAVIHNLSISIDSWINLTAIKQASGLAFVCKTLSERFLHLGLNHPRIAICYNPVIADQNNPSLNSTAKSWLSNSQLITFVSAARFHYPKDHKTLLQAFAKASETYSNIRLILLGDGDLETDIQALANSLNLRDIVLFAGSVPNPRAYFSLSRAVILASTFEGFGMVIVEAVASGVTFIASDCPVGPREISEVLKCGTLVPPSDVNALAAAIIEHVKTPPEKIDRSEQIERLFSESSCAENLELLIQQIIC